MFYKASIIKFSLILELLWKSTLLVHYKLNRFRFLQVNQLDIHLLLLGVYDRLIPLDKMVYI